MPRFFSIGLPILVLAVASIGWITALTWTPSQEGLPAFAKRTSELLFGAVIVLALFLAFQGSVR